MLERLPEAVLSVLAGSTVASFLIVGSAILLALVGSDE